MTCFSSNSSLEPSRLYAPNLRGPCAIFWDWTGSLHFPTLKIGKATSTFQFPYPKTMSHPLNPATAPLSRKRTERLSPEPEVDGPPDSKRRQLAPAQSFADVLKEMPANESSPPLDTSDLLNKALVFQYVDIQPNQNLNIPMVLIFGVTERGDRIVVHVASNLRMPNPVDGFLLHYKIKAMSWMEIPVSKFKSVNASEKLSYNQEEFVAQHEDIIIHPLEEPCAKFAPLHILSFDIETMVAPDNGMARYDHESIIQIGNILAIKGAPNPYFRCVFTLNTCHPIEGAEVKSFDDESTMLLAWRDFVVENDPDLIIGHNIGKFDFPQLILRAEFLRLEQFLYLGRLKGVRATAKRLPASKRWFKDSPILAGRLQLDTLQHFQERTMERTTEERTATGRPKCDLNTVSLEFLGKKKDDIHFMKINPLQQGGPEHRRQLAVYCLNDAYLPLRLLECQKLRCIEESIEAARANVQYMYRPFGQFLRNGRNPVY
ncbi:ribonuclease H-like domain-containing protein [Mycena haematopus]|nr:ribonuclease H-like domain-containing protein [Mycena haematopus]